MKRSIALKILFGVCLLESFGGRLVNGGIISTAIGFIGPSGLCFNTVCRLNIFKEDYCCNSGCCTKQEYDAENALSCSKTLQKSCGINLLNENYCCRSGLCCTKEQYDAEIALGCTQSACKLSQSSDDYCCKSGSCCTKYEYDTENVISVNCTQSACKLSSSSDDYCCKSGSCCTKYEYDTENIVSVGCSQSACKLSPSSGDYCCKSGSCCTKNEYDAENNIADTTSLGIGAILGIVGGVIVFIILCVVACVYIFCRPIWMNHGTVVHDRTVSAQTYAMEQKTSGQQYSLHNLPNPGAQAYIPQGGYNPADASGKV